MGHNFHSALLWHVRPKNTSIRSGQQDMSLLKWNSRLPFLNFALATTLPIFFGACQNHSFALRNVHRQGRDMKSMQFKIEVTSDTLE